MADARASLRKPAALPRRPVVALKAQPVAAAARSPMPAARSLQQRLGNRGTQALAAQVVARSTARDSPSKNTPSGQLLLSHPGDAQEREADTVAEKVMRMAEPSGVHSHDAPSAAASAAQVHRACQHCEEEKKEEKIQRKEGSGEASEFVPSVSSDIRSLQGGGSPLPPATRAFFEPRFGADFSHVQVHRNARAEETAKSINAEAFTVGSDIAFGAGKYAPDSVEGRRLLAHELAHVVQQQAGTTGGIARLPLSVARNPLASAEDSATTDAIEAEADAAADAALAGEGSETRVTLSPVPVALFPKKGGKAPPKVAPPKGTYALKKGSGASAYLYTFNSQDIAQSPNPWELVVRKHFRNVFPAAPGGAEDGFLSSAKVRKIELGGKNSDAKEVAAYAKTVKTIDVSIEPSLHREMLAWMKSTYPNVRPASPVEATHALEEGAGPAPAPSATAPAGIAMSVQGSNVILPGNLKPEDRDKILKTLGEILVAPEPSQKADKPPADLTLSLKGVEMLLQIGNDPALLARMKAAGRPQAGGPDFEQSLEIVIANETAARARKRLGLGEPTGSRNDAPIENRPVHGQIKNLTGHLVPSQEAHFVFEVLDDRDAFRVPMISIHWYAYPEGKPDKLVDDEVTNYIPVRSQGLLNDRIFNVTFHEPGKYEIEAFVSHNFFLPAWFPLPNGVVVLTETALAAALNQDELEGFAGQGITAPRTFRIGGQQGLQMGTETRGKLDAKARILTIEDRLKTVADEEKMVKDLIANYEGQRGSEAEAIVKWAKNYLETLEEGKGSLKKDKGGVPLGVRGVFVSRETDYPSKALKLLCYFFRTSDGYLLVLRDFTQLYEQEDYRFEAKDKTVEKSEEKAFIKQADAYPLGTLSVTFQTFDETTHKPTDQFVRFEKITDTPEKKLKKFLFGTAVDIAVNLLAAILMIIPGLQVLGIALAIAYNTAKTVSELEDAANKGTLSAGKIGVGIAQIALNVLPLAGRGAKLMTIAGKTFYVMEAVNVAGNILLITQQGMSEVDKVRNGVIKELAEVDGQIRNLEATNLADPSLPELKAKRRQLIKDGEQATVNVFTQLLGQQALMMIGQHLVLGYMSRKFSVGELKSEGVFRHEKDAKPRYDFKDGVIVGDEFKISPSELDRLQTRHRENKALQGVIADPTQRQQVIEAFGDRPVEVKTKSAKTELRQEGEKTIFDVADGAKAADILREAQRAQGLPPPKPPEPTKAAKAAAETGKAAPEDTFKPMEPPPQEAKEPKPKAPLDEKELEAEAEHAPAVEAQARTAYQAAKKKGYGGEFTEERFVEKYKDGEVYNLDTNRWRTAENVAKPPPEPFPVGTTREMIQERLTGKDSTSSFKRYYEMLKQQKIADEAELRIAIDEVRAEYKLDTEAATVDDVRHALKERFRPKVLKSMFEAADGTKLDPKASHKKMLEITEKLNSADKGTLTEEWVQGTRKAAREAVGLTEEVPQRVKVKKADHPALTEDRQLDRIEGDTINEIKSTDGYLSTRDKAEIADHLKLIGTEGATVDVRGTPRIVKAEKVTFLHPEGARKNADYIIEQLERFDTLSVEVFNDAGESRVFAKTDVIGANAGKLHEFIGKKYQK